MKHDAQVLREYEAMISSTIQKAAVEHEALIRKAMALSGNQNLIVVTYSSFFGHTLEFLSRIVGKEKALAMARQLLEEIETAHAVVEASKEQGVTLDPIAVVASRQGGKPS